MSPSKRRTLTGWPAGEVSWSTRDLVSLCTINRLHRNLLGWGIQPDYQPDITGFPIRTCDPLGLVHQRLDEEHAHTAGVFFAVNLAVDIGSGRHGLQALAVVDDLDLQGAGTRREYYANGEAFVQSIAMFHGIDTGFGDGGLEILDAVLAETHELGDGGGGAHGYLFVAEAGRQTHLDGGGLGPCRLDAGHAGNPAMRQSANAVMSSPCGPPSTK